MYWPLVVRCFYFAFMSLPVLHNNQLGITSRPCNIVLVFNQQPQQTKARICKRLSSPGIDSASLCRVTGRYVKWGCRTGPQGWESIPGLLKRFTNTGSGKGNHVSLIQYYQLPALFSGFDVCIVYLLDTTSVSKNYLIVDVLLLCFIIILIFFKTNQIQILPNFPDLLRSKPFITEPHKALFLVFCF